VGEPPRSPFLGEVVTDQRDVNILGKRVPGRQVKHRMKSNWIKMYDKGTVLRVETVINDPEEIRVRRRVRRNGRDAMAWVPLRKSVTMPFRYREISAQSIVRYLGCLEPGARPTPSSPSSPAARSTGDTSSKSRVPRPARPSRPTARPESPPRKARA
jgi:hypothetical protein